jgi:DNA polymerase-3 subunit chi
MAGCAQFTLSRSRQSRYPWAMSDVWFYHLTHRPLEKALPTLVEKSRERGWKVMIRVGSPERLGALDDLLWTYEDESFLAHGTSAEADSATQPVLLTLEDERPNGAEILFLVDNAPLPADWPYERIVMIFDGQDQDAVESARAAWKTVKSLGHTATYWQQDDNGRWSKKG